MEAVTVDLAFLEHLANCIMLQKIINNDNIKDYKDEQHLIDQAVRQIRSIIQEQKEMNKRSLAQKSRGMYEEHQTHTELKLSEYTGPKDEKGNY